LPVKVELTTVALPATMPPVAWHSQSPRTIVRDSRIHDRRIVLGLDSAAPEVLVLFETVMPERVVV